MSASTMSVPAHYKLNTIKQQTVTTTAVVMTALAITDSVKAPYNILVQALSTNAGPVTIGNSSGVTAGGAGIELVAGANINLPSKNISDWYVICASGTQKLNLIYSEQVE